MKTITKSIEYGVYNNSNHDVCIYQAATQKEAEDFIESLKNPHNYSMQECYEDGDLYNIERLDQCHPDDIEDFEDEIIVEIGGVEYVATKWRFCDDK